MLSAGHKQDWINICIFLPRFVPHILNFRWSFFYLNWFTLLYYTAATYVRGLLTHLSREITNHWIKLQTTTIHIFVTNSQWQASWLSSSARITTLSTFLYIIMGPVSVHLYNQVEINRANRHFMCIFIDFITSFLIWGSTLYCTLIIPKVSIHVYLD